MKKVKYFCDRCGKTLSSEQRIINKDAVYTNNFEPYPTSGGSLHYYSYGEDNRWSSMRQIDLCDECFKKVIDIIEKRGDSNDSAE